MAGGSRPDAARSTGGVLITGATAHRPGPTDAERNDLADAEQYVPLNHLHDHGQQLAMRQRQTPTRW